MYKVDINCDMGELSKNDSSIINYISSANIACGFHAGDDNSIKKTINLAIENSVIIGAHPGYDDKENFGRVELHYENSKIVDLILQQLYNFNVIANKEGGKLSYVKLHGALYNRAVNDEKLAYDILYNVNREYSNIMFLALSMSKMCLIANQMNILCVNEVFSDRSYNDDGTLVSRKIKGALIQNSDEVKKRVITMVKENKVHSINSKLIDIVCDSICIHGDGVNALEYARVINKSLIQEGIIIESKM